MKVMFVGLGSIGQRHLRNLITLRKDEPLDLIAYRAKRSVPLLDPSMGVTRDVSVSEKYGVREFDTLEAALAERPDIVFVTNPSALHMPVAIAAAKAGCHLFIEKPLSDGLDDLPALESAVVEAGVAVAVGYQFRNHPAVRTAKAWLDEGRIGPVVKARFENGEYLPGWHPYEDYREGYAARSDLGGGALLTQIHDFDLALHLLGAPDRVFCSGGQLTGLEIDVDDCVTVVMETPSGGRAIPVTIDLDYIQRPPVRGFKIVGDRGVIRCDLRNPVVELFVDGELADSGAWPDLDRDVIFLSELEDFLAAVDGRGAPAVDLQQGVASLRMALAAARSLKSGASEPL